MRECVKVLHLGNKKVKDVAIMFKRNNVHRTPKQKAEKAALNVLARLAGCAFLVYYVVQLLTAADAPKTPVAIIIGIVFVIAAAVVIVINVLDFFRGWKEGRFKAETYAEDELPELDVHPEEDEQSSGSEQDDEES